MPREKTSLHPLVFGNEWKNRATSLKSFQEQMQRVFGWTSVYDAIDDQTTFANEQATFRIDDLSIICTSHTPIYTRVHSDHLSFFLPISAPRTARR